MMMPGAKDLLTFCPWHRHRKGSLKERMKQTYDLAHKKGDRKLFFKASE